MLYENFEGSAFINKISPGQTLCFDYTITPQDSTCICRKGIPLLTWRLSDRGIPLSFHCGLSVIRSFLLQLEGGGDRPQLATLSSWCSAVLYRCTHHWKCEQRWHQWWQRGCCVRGRSLHLMYSSGTLSVQLLVLPGNLVVIYTTKAFVKSCVGELWINHNNYNTVLKLTVPKIYFCTFTILRHTITTNMERLQRVPGDQAAVTL